MNRSRSSLDRLHNTVAFLYTGNYIQIQIISLLLQRYDENNSGVTCKANTFKIN